MPVQNSDVSDLIESEKDRRELPGIGKVITGSIRESMETDSLARMKEIEGGIPPEPTKLMKAADWGPKG